MQGCGRVVWGLTVVLVALAAWPGERRPPQRDGATRSAAAELFGVRYAAVMAQLDDAAYRDADRSLRRMFAEQSLRGEILRAGDEVREAVVRCAFGLSYRPPDVAGLFGVGSASWNRRSGRLEVVFDRDSERHAGASSGLADVASAFSFHPRGFSVVDGVCLFDVPFSGRCQIAIRGRLPEHKNDRKRPPQLVLRVDDRLAYTADFTWPTTYRKSRGLWSQGTIYEWDSGVSRLLATDPTPGGKYDMMWGQRYELKLVVKSSSLVASLQGYGMLSVAKLRRTYGRLGFRWCPSVERLCVSGIVEPDVMQGLYDLHRATAFAAFADAVEVGDLLPDWLRTGEGG